MSTSKTRRRGSVPASSGALPFKALVYSKGHTLSSLAKLCGVPQRHLQAFASGAAGRKTARLDAVARSLGLDRSDVVASITESCRVAAERFCG